MPSQRLWRRLPARVSAGRSLFSDPVGPNSARAAVGLVGGDSSSRIVNEIRRRLGSTSNTLTRTTSPGFATLRGSLTYALAIAEMCTNPSWWTPTSTKAPNEATFVTTPSRTMPGLRSSNFSTPSRKFADLKTGADHDRASQLPQDVGDGRHPEHGISDRLRLAG